MSSDARTSEGARSRRALLFGALGGVGAWAAAAMGRANPVRAGVDGDVRLGLDNQAATPTTIQNNTTSNVVFQVLATYSGGNTKGIEASAFGGTAIKAYNDGGTSGWGIVGENVIGPWAAVVGHSKADGTGVQGFSAGSPSTVPAGVAKTGVYGVALQDANSRGVYGRATSGRGVFGEATSGNGVRAYSATGAALYARTSTLKKGVALQTVGKVKFENSVGVATVLAGTNSVVVTPGIDLTATSVVVATLQGSAGGSTTVRMVTIDATADTFRITLTANAASNVKVGWHAFN